MCVLPPEVHLHCRFFRIDRRDPLEAPSTGSGVQRTHPDWCPTRCFHWTSAPEPPAQINTQTSSLHCLNPHKIITNIYISSKRFRFVGIVYTTHVGKSEGDRPPKNKTLSNNHKTCWCCLVLFCITDLICLLFSCYSRWHRRRCPAPATSEWVCAPPQCSASFLQDLSETWRHGLLVESLISAVKYMSYRLVFLEFWLAGPWQTWVWSSQPELDKIFHLHIQKQQRQASLKYNES